MSQCMRMALPVLFPLFTVVVVAVVVAYLFGIVYIVNVDVVVAVTVYADSDAVSVHAVLSSYYELRCLGCC